MSRKGPVQHLPFRASLPLDGSSTGRIDLVFAKGPLRVKRISMETGLRKKTADEVDEDAVVAGERVRRATVLGAERFVRVARNGLAAECDGFRWVGAEESTGDKWKYYSSLFPGFWERQSWRKAGWKWSLEAKPARGTWTA